MRLVECWSQLGRYNTVLLIWCLFGTCKDCHTHQRLKKHQHRSGVSWSVVMCLVVLFFYFPTLDLTVWKHCLKTQRSWHGLWNRPSELDHWEFKLSWAWAASIMGQDGNTKDGGGEREWGHRLSSTKSVIVVYFFRGVSLLSNQVIALNNFNFQPCSSYSVSTIIVIVVLSWFW